MPSPHHYQIDQHNISRTQQGVKFSKDKRGIKVQVGSPGPGSYEH